MPQFQLVQPEQEVGRLLRIAVEGHQLRRIVEGAGHRIDRMEVVRVGPATISLACVR